MPEQKWTDEELRETDVGLVELVTMLDEADLDTLTKDCLSQTILNRVTMLALHDPLAATRAAFLAGCYFNQYRQTHPRPTNIPSAFKDFQERM